MASGKRGGGRRPRARAEPASPERLAACPERGEADYDSERSALDPLYALLDGDGPLAPLRLELADFPAAAPEGDPREAVARHFAGEIGRLANEAWRAAARRLLGGLVGELSGATEDAPARHPDGAALEAALEWLAEERASGLRALENTFLLFVFERSFEAAAAAQSLPRWAARLAAPPAGYRRTLFERRAERAATRLAVGPFQDELPVDDLPRVRPLISGPPLPPGELALVLGEAADQDLTPERRAAAAERLRRAGNDARGLGQTLYAFDLETIALALSREDPIARGLVRVYYMRSFHRRRSDATASDSEWPTG